MFVTRTVKIVYTQLRKGRIKVEKAVAFSSIDNEYGDDSDDNELSVFQWRQLMTILITCAFDVNFSRLPVFLIGNELQNNLSKVF